jgi:hypothetical protein
MDKYADLRDEGEHIENKGSSEVRHQMPGHITITHPGILKVVDWFKPR